MPRGVDFVRHNHGFAALVGGGLCVGLAGLPAGLWPLAWLGAGLVAYGVEVERRAAGAWLGLMLATLVQHGVWFSWAPQLARAMRPLDRSLDTVIGVGMGVVEALPVAACFSLGWALRRRVPVVAWLPSLWVVGERLTPLWTSISADWLVTQPDVAPVMRLLGRVGLPATTWACLFAAASCARAVARRSPRWLTPAAVLCVGLALLPRLDVKSERLEGVAVVHLRTHDEYPAALSRRDRLVVWPETAFSARPSLREGAAPVGARLDFALGPPGAWHLVGLETLLQTTRQNSAVLVDPLGAITAARAKRKLLPVFERPFLGFGREQFDPGVVAPLLKAQGLAVIPLICGELLTRELIAEGRAAGGEVLTVLARDHYQAHTALAQHLVLSTLQLRAVEYGVPAAYASVEGQAVLLGADGVVLARSEANAASGVLRWSAREGATDDTRPASPPVTVLYSAATPQLRPDCPPGACRYTALESLRDGGVLQATRTLIIAGHGSPPAFLGTTPQELAQRARAAQPELVVVDSCYGAESTLLKALAPLAVPIVAAPGLVAGRGFVYGPEFFAADASVASRTQAVRTEPVTPLFVGAPDSEALTQAERDVAAADGASLRPRVRAWVPTLVGAQLSGASAEVLVAADWRKIGTPPSGGPDGG